MALVLALGLMPEFAFAASSEDEEEIAAIWVVEDGVVTEITYEEYLDLMAGEIYYYDDDNDPAIGMYRRGMYTYEYKPNYTAISFNSPVYVSQCVSGGENGASVNASFSVTTSVSYSSGLSASAKEVIFDALSLSFSIGKSVSSSYGSASGSSYPVPAGKYGKIQFQQKMVNSVGTLTTTDGSMYPPIVTTQSVQVNAPAQLSTGIADGVYTVVLKDYAF